jgi:oxygen-dependent protoporphyrinogen oxidase
MKKTIVVIGGGMAGTAAAYELRRRGYAVTIIEKADRLGGRIRSEQVDGTGIEMGAAFMTNAYTNVFAFLAAHGLSNRLTRQRGSTGLVRGERIYMATATALMGNKLLSWRTKAQLVRLLLTVLVSWRQINMHEPWKLSKYDTASIADMFKDAAHEEFLEDVLQPALQGYFFWAPEGTSRVLYYIIGKALLKGGTYKMRGGLQQIPEKAAQGAAVLLNHSVAKVQRQPDGTYRIEAECAGKRCNFEADGIVCATTATAVPKLFDNLTPNQKQFFQAVNYTSTAVLARTYLRSQTRGDKGLAFPRRYKSVLAAVALRPEPSVGDRFFSTLKAYATDTVGRNLYNKDNAQIAATLTKGMEPVLPALLRPNAQPIAEHVQQWREALPIADPGCFKRLKAFASGEIEDQTQAVVFAGDYIGGPFIEGAFTSGVAAAVRLDERLSSS